MESPLLPASDETASPPSAAQLPLAQGAVRLRIVPQLGAGECQQTQLIGWPAEASPEVVEFHLRKVLQLSREQEIVLLPQGSLQENCAPLRLHDLLSMSTNEPLVVSHEFSSRSIPMRRTLLSEEEISYGRVRSASLRHMLSSPTKEAFLDRSRSVPMQQSLIFQKESSFDKSRLFSSSAIEIEAALDDLSFLDTQTTYLAVERALLATIRFIISMMKASAEALHDDSHVEDHREMLKILAPCLVGILWVLYMIDVICWVSYFKVIGASLEQMQQYFSIEGQEKLASSQTCLISGAIVAAASIAYGLFIFIPDIDSS
jgi:hypothetical protein